MPTVALRLRLVEKHPGRAELVAEHCEAIRKMCLLHLHEDLAIGRQQRIHALRVVLSKFYRSKIITR